MVGLGAVGHQLALVRMVPRKSHEPLSRETRLVCLPCQPAPALRQRLFHQRSGIDKHLHIRAASRRELPGKLFKPALDHIVIVAPARIDRHIALVARRQIVHRVVVRAVIHRQHDGASGLRPHGGRAGAARRRFRPATPCHPAGRPPQSRSGGRRFPAAAWLL